MEKRSGRKRNNGGKKIKGGVRGEDGGGGGGGGGGQRNGGWKERKRRRALVFGETEKPGTREESVDEERRTKDRVSSVCSTAGAI